MGLVNSCCTSLASGWRRLLAYARSQALGLPGPGVVPSASAPSELCEPSREPVTALPLFGEMVLYGFADGELLGVESQTRAVLLRERLPKELLEADLARKSARSFRGSVETFRKQHLEAFRPAVLRQSAQGWPAMEKWDFEFFAKHCGDIEVEATLRQGKRQKLLLRDYLNVCKLQAGGDELPYLRGWYYQRDAPWLQKDLWEKGDFHDVAFQDWFKRLPARHHPDFHWLFIGAAGAITPLHIDPSATHAWLSQISGRKRFTLFAPSDLPELLSESGGFKPIADISVKRQEIVLEPGDTIFVPAHWAHQVECLDDSISVTWNFLGESLFPTVRAAFLANAAKPAYEPEL
ncbi:unnamed protein product [Effrenium voratum]|nr:unnamed protein product [Effrenium voratum]